MTVTHAGAGHLQALSPAPDLTSEQGPQQVDTSLRDDLRRLGFLPTLEARTWSSRSRAAAVLADPGAVASRTAYAAWLRRLATAWSRVALPSLPGAVPSVWPFPSVGPRCLDVLGPLQADLRDLALAAGGVVVPAPAVPTIMPTTMPTTMPTAASPSREQELAVLAGAAYAAVVLCSEAALLVPGALALAIAPRAPLGLRFLRTCAGAAAVRTPLRRELAGWAESLPQPEGRDAAELAVRTAGDLMGGLADALHGPRRGW